MSQRSLEIPPIDRQRRFHRAFPVTQPLLEETDCHVAQDAALAGGLGFHLAVKFVRDLKGGFHGYTLLFCWGCVNPPALETHSPCKLNIMCGIFMGN